MTKKQIRALPNVISGLDERADALINRAIEIYNANPNNMGFSSTLPHRQNVVICYYTDEHGNHIASLVMDTARNNLTGKSVGMCQIIAVEEKWRGNGLCQKLVKMAAHICENNSIEFAGAYIDNNDEIRLWEKLGFTHHGSIGFVLTMTKAPIKDLLGSD